MELFFLCPVFVDGFLLIAFRPRSSGSLMDLNKKILMFISKPPVPKRDTLDIDKLAKAFEKMILLIIIRLKKTDRLLESVVN